MSHLAKYALAALLGGLILWVGVGRADPRLQAPPATGTTNDVARRALATRGDGVKVLVVTLKVDQQAFINNHVDRPGDFVISFAPDVNSVNAAFVCYAAKHHKHGNQNTRPNHITLGIKTNLNLEDLRTGAPTSGTITIQTTTGDLNPVQVPVDDTDVDPCDGEEMVRTPRAPRKG